MRQLAGKTALVTGAAAGIGRAIALRLSRAGVHVILLDCDQAGLVSLRDEIAAGGAAARTLVCDLRTPAQITAAVREVLAEGGVDILVNNAGVATYGPSHEMTEAEWNRVLSINLLAPVQITRELLPSLLARSEAHILNVSSLAGLVALPRVAAYTVSKFGLQGLSESLRMEYGNQGLGVTALCPGFVETGIYDAATAAGSPRRPKRVARWLMTTADQVAERALIAIRRNEPVVAVTWLTRLLWWARRAAPNLLLRWGASRSRKPAQFTQPWSLQTQEG